MATRDGRSGFGAPHGRPGGKGRRPSAAGPARRPPRRPDPYAERAAEIARTTGLPFEAARQVAAGRADLNELLKKMAFEDEVRALMARHELNRALATQILLGHASLDQVLVRRRTDAALRASRDRSVLDEAVRSGRELTLGVHGPALRRVRVREVARYELTVVDVETGAEEQLHKLRLKYAYATDDHKKARKAIDVDRSRRDAPSEPIVRPQDRFACSDRRLGAALDRKVAVTATTLEGDRIAGEVAWVSRYEFAVRTRAGVEVVIFRHALAGFEES